MRLCAALFGWMSLRRAAWRSLGVQGIRFCRLILTSSDRRAEAPKRGQDHKSHPSRCLMGRQCPPDDLQVPIDFLSSSFPTPSLLLPLALPIGSGLCRRTRIGSLGKNLQRRLIWLRGPWKGSGTGHTGDRLSSGTASLWYQCQAWNVPFGQRKEGLISRVAWFSLLDPTHLLGFGVHGWHCGAMSKTPTRTME